MRRYNRKHMVIQILAYGIGALLFFTLASVLIFVAVSDILGRKKGYGVPFVATPYGLAKEALMMCVISKNDVFYDLGCGDGRMVFLAEQAGAKKVVGYETALWPYVMCVARKWISGSRAQFYKQDFFEKPIGDATIIYAYLMPDPIKKLEEKIKKECRPYTRLVIQDYPFTAIHEVRKTTHGRHTLYSYIIAPEDIK